MLEATFYYSIVGGEGDVDVEGALVADSSHNRGICIV